MLAAGAAEENEEDAEAQETGSSESQVFAGIERVFTNGLFSLCLVALGNALHALDVGEGRGGDGSPGESVKKFIDDTRSAFGVDVLSSLVRVLGRARRDPHDAYHSARCLGVLFRECGGSHRARAR